MLVSVASEEGPGRLDTHRYVNKGDAGAKVRVWIYLVDQGVLAPVANHEADAEQCHGKNENEDSGARAGIRVQRVDGVVVA